MRLVGLVGGLVGRGLCCWYVEFGVAGGWGPLVSERSYVVFGVR